MGKIDYSTFAYPKDTYVPKKKKKKRLYKVYIIKKEKEY